MKFFHKRGMYKMYYVIYEQPLMIMIRIMNDVNDNVREAHGCLDNGL